MKFKSNLIAAFLLAMLSFSTTGTFAQAAGEAFHPTFWGSDDSDGCVYEVTVKSFWDEPSARNQIVKTTTVQVLVFGGGVSYNITAPYSTSTFSHAEYSATTTNWSENNLTQTSGEHYLMGNCHPSSDPGYQSTVWNVMNPTTHTFQIFSVQFNN